MNQLSLFSDSPLNDPVFREYHERNPHIYRKFKMMAMQAVKLKQNWSARAIFQIMRWNTALKGEGDRYKINNIFSPDYVDLFEWEFPYMKGFFRKRVRKARRRQAH